MVEVVNEVQISNDPIKVTESGMLTDCLLDHHSNAFEFRNACGHSKDNIRLPKINSWTLNVWKWISFSLYLLDI